VPAYERYLANQCARPGLEGTPLRLRFRAPNGQPPGQSAAAAATEMNKFAVHRAFSWAG
jgi:hypothetical protein